MPDVQLLDLGNLGDRTKIQRGESVARVNSQLELRGQRCGAAQGRDGSGIAGTVGKITSVEFDGVGVHLPRHSHRCLVGADEQAGANTRIAQHGNCPLDSLCVLNDVQPAFGRHFLSAFRDESDLVWSGGDGDRHHLIGAGELEIEVGPDGRSEDPNVGVLDVTTVFPEMGSDPIHADFLADQGGLHRVGLVTAPRLSQSRDVVDVDIKALVACSHIRPEYNFFPMKKLLLAFVVVGALACTAAPPSTSVVDNSPGAKTSSAAVERFFAAVHAQDLQAMSLVWGTSKGAARDNMDRAELEKREVILQCYFNFNTFRIVSESPTSEVRRMVRVELQRDGKTRTPVVYTVLGPGGRWYVENLDIAAVKDFCAMAPVSPGNL